MNRFEQFDALLSGNYGDDYWSDEALFAAFDILNSFTEADWNKADTLWNARPAIWQNRFADALASGVPEKGVPLLVAMIEHGDDELAINAADSLNSTDAKLALAAMNQNALDRLQRLSGRDRNSKLIVDELMQKFKQMH